MAEQRLRALLVAGPERGPELARDPGHGAQRRGQPRRAGGLDDDPVELLVVGDLVGDLRAAAVGLAAQRPHALELLGVDAGRRAGGGMRLDQRPDLVEVQQIGGIERADDRAAMGLDGHEPLALEHQQRLADRRSAGAEPLGQRLRPQPRAGRHLTLEDRRPQRIVNPDRARGSFGRGGHGCIQNRRVAPLSKPSFP